MAPYPVAPLWIRSCNPHLGHEVTKAFQVGWRLQTHQQLMSLDDGMEASWRGKPQNPVAKWDRSHMIWMMKICWWNIDRGVQTIQQQRLWESPKTTCELEKFSTSPSYVHPKSKPLFFGGGKNTSSENTLSSPKTVREVNEAYSHQTLILKQQISAWLPTKISWFPWNQLSLPPKKSKPRGSPQKNCLFTWSVGPSPVIKPQKISHTLW